jgi:hypothetical protein
MILSASRRTDIPAFYSKWFFKRLEEGRVLVRNPMNHRQVSSVELSHAVIDCIVFWTKDPTAILGKLGLLADYHFYFQITLNAYGRGIERHLPEPEKIIDSFRKLSDMIGSNKTLWRYDPIIITDEMDMDFHCRHFGYLAERLGGYTERCTISFYDRYLKTERNMKGLDQKEADGTLMTEMAKRLNEIAAKHNIKLYSCCESIDPDETGVMRGSCIDGSLISQIIGKPLKAAKDKNQRVGCGCMESIDIGAYNTCGFGCRYCYANFSDTSVNSSRLRHDPDSPMLIGYPEPDDKITVREMKSLVHPDGQPSAL